MLEEIDLRARFFDFATAVMLWQHHKIILSKLDYWHIYDGLLRYLI